MSIEGKVRGAAHNAIVPEAVQQVLKGLSKHKQNLKPLVAITRGELPACSRGSLALAALSDRPDSNGAIAGAFE
jgi:hypothetical protein